MPPLPERTGTIDFRPYWSSAYLFAKGQDFSNLEKMDTIERTLTGWKENITMMAWFAPTGNLVLLPLTFLSFQRAAYYWLLINIVVIFSSALLIWPRKNTKLWIPLLAVFSFSMTLLSLLYGQINTFVLFGLALYWFFINKNQDFYAGASLVLTTIKPHLVILALPLLLVDLVRRRRWLALTGFFAVSLFVATFLFAINPSWPFFFWNLVKGGMDSTRMTPTFNGILVLFGISTYGKWIWIVGLLSAMVLWIKYGKNWTQPTMIDSSILAGLMIAPIGWSYDQIMLLIPIVHILDWAATGYLQKKETILMIGSLCLVYIVGYFQRSFGPGDVWFFWIPIAVAVIYAQAWRHKKTIGAVTIPQRV